MLLSAFGITCVLFGIQLFRVVNDFKDSINQMRIDDEKKHLGVSARRYGEKIKDSKVLEEEQ